MTRDIAELGVSDLDCGEESGSDRDELGAGDHAVRVEGSVRITADHARLGESGDSQVVPRVGIQDVSEGILSGLERRGESLGAEGAVDRRWWRLQRG